MYSADTQLRIRRLKRRVEAAATDLLFDRTEKGPRPEQNLERLLRQRKQRGEHERAALG